MSFSVYFFGDSICFGQYVSPHHTWISRVSNEMENDLLPLNIESLVQNPSVNGNTTRMALERMPFDVQGKDVDILVIQFGLNDCNHWLTDLSVPRVSMASFKSNFKEMINRAKTFHISKVFLNTNHQSGLTKPFTNMTISHHQSGIAYNEIIRDVAKEYRDYVILCDFENELLARNLKFDDYLLPDMIHLNKNGHKVYFDIFYPKLRSEMLSMVAVKNA